MEAEVLVDRLCLENGIPASKVVFIDCSKTIVDRDFMAVERIESKPLSDPSIEREEYPPIFKECGAILKKMHGIKGEKFGRAVLNEENDWSHTFRELPKNDENGRRIEYTVAEENVPKNYFASYDTTWLGKVIITNTYTEEHNPSTGAPGI